MTDVSGDRPDERDLVELVTTLMHFSDALARGLAANTHRPRLAILETVAEREPLRPRELGEQLAMPAASVTRHLQALQDAGHVQVVEDPDDRRTCLVSITPEGLAELQDIAQVGAEVTGRVLADWSATEVRVLTDLLQRLTAAWADRGEEARRPTATRSPRWRRPRQS